MFVGNNLFLKIKNNVYQNLTLILRYQIYRYNYKNKEYNI